MANASAANPQRNDAGAASDHTAPAQPPASPSSQGMPAEGCWYLVYGRDGSAPSHEGTLRVQARGGQLLASGDLYVFDDAKLTEPLSAGQWPAPGPGVPIFAIGAYAYHLRIIALEAAEAGFVLAFEAHRYIAHGSRLRDGGHWTLEDTLRLPMQPADAPPGHPRPERFYVGEFSVESPLSTKTMRLQMGWVSPSLRQAVIEIDCVPGTYAPMDNGAGLDWRGVFAACGWEVSAIASDHDLAKAGTDPVWTAADARAAMMARRDRHDLDAQWRYYAVIAPTIQAPGKAHGHMFHGRREALFVGGHSLFPDEPHYGALRGRRLDSAPEFFRTVVHEVGHAMGLDHNAQGFHFMRPTPTIAEGAPAGQPFPANVQWSFDPDDLHHLRHAPDILVRPGGAALGTETAGAPVP